ncbi:hypothetical protein N9864_00135 [bacterium]|nr:hypothetical protein [bacterium]
MEDNKPNFPTETIELPSKGLVYPESNPLSSGKIEMKYMTAKEEDILSNQSYIKDGTVIDKLLQSLIVTKIDYKDLIVGDKNAILISSRILGYGAEYSFEHKGEEVTVDLSTLEHKEINVDNFPQGQNEFSYKLKTTGDSITFKLLTHGDEIRIDEELKGLKRINKKSSKDVSTRLKYMIQSINGDDNPSSIRTFVDNNFLARDAREFRLHIKSFQPDINMKVSVETSDGTDDIELPISLNFFWPDVEL